MGKSSKSSSSESKSKSASKKIDPTLASLFESSFGAVAAPEPKPVVAVAKPETPEEESEEDGDDANADLSELEDGDDSDNEQDDAESAASTEGAAVEDVTTDRSRKRKRKAAEEDLEGTYMSKVYDEDKPTKKAKADAKKAEKAAAKEDERDPNESEDSDSDNEDGKKKKKTKAEFPIKHESLTSPAEIELDKSNRTVFLGNVPSNAISSKSDYKTLKQFFSTAGKISSVRFRSIAFSEQIPRKAAFVNHKLHEKQQTVNAYIVYKDVASAREALKLNGSIVLDRHIRVDSVAHPAKQETRQCVFVGNLDFETQEERLWRHFGQCGKVDYVRVIRDSKTNVGKGFAYVQFADAMSVEQALLLDGKKMEGDRKLRVTRAKAIKRHEAKAKADARKPTNVRRPAPQTGRIYVPKIDAKDKAHMGRASKLLGKAGASALKKQTDAFEGLRATADTASGVKSGGSGKKKGGKERARKTARSVAWKKKA